MDILIKKNEVEYYSTGGTLIYRFKDKVKRKVYIKQRKTGKVVDGLDEYIYFICSAQGIMPDDSYSMTDGEMLGISTSDLRESDVSITI